MTVQMMFYTQMNSTVVDGKSRPFARSYQKDCLGKAIFIRT
jgi:hypothetical protein